MSQFKLVNPAAAQGELKDIYAAVTQTFGAVPCAVLDNKGQVTAAEVNAVRNAGYNDAQIAEIIGHVGLNTLLNYFGKATRIDIDFPQAPVLTANA